MTNDALRKRVARAIEREAFRKAYPGWIGASQVMTDAALAALGLDDLDAAVERVGQALLAFDSMEPDTEEYAREEGRAALAALLATETKGSPDG